MLYIYNYTMLHKCGGAVSGAPGTQPSDPSLDLGLIEFQPLYHLSRDQTIGTNCLRSFSEIEPRLLTSNSDSINMSGHEYSFFSVCFLIFLFLEFKRIKHERWKYILSEQDRYGNLFPSEPAMTKHRSWRQKNQENNISEINFTKNCLRYICFGL